MEFKVLPFPIKIYPVEIFTRAAPGSSLAIDIDTTCRESTISICAEWCNVVIYLSPESTAIATDAAEEETETPTSEWTFRGPTSKISPVKWNIWKCQFHNTNTGWMLIVDWPWSVEEVCDWESGESPWASWWSVVLKIFMRYSEYLLSASSVSTISWMAFTFSFILLTRLRRRTNMFSLLLTWNDQFSKS